ncbi:hypothetical protein V2J09_021847 [Rumex salicifolius]
MESLIIAQEILNTVHIKRRGPMGFMPRSINSIGIRLRNQLLIWLWTSSIQVPCRLRLMKPSLTCSRKWKPLKS